jgi:dienelactone hydrolase
MIARPFALLALIMAAHAAVIPAGALKPGADILVDCPELGDSTVLAEGGTKAPVRLGLHLPMNWRKECRFPVILYLGPAAGGCDNGLWKAVVHDRNFVLIAIDYSSPSVTDRGLRNAAFALDLVDRTIAIDRNAVVLTGVSSGAYCITDEYGCAEAKRFAAFVVICGGMMMDAATVGARPVMIIAGERDTDPASGGRSRVEVQRETYAALRRGGADATLILQPGMGHGWDTPYYPPVEDWLYRTTRCAELQRMYLIDRLLPQTTLPWRTSWYQQALAASAFELPSSAAARAAKP